MLLAGRMGVAHSGVLSTQKAIHSPTVAGPGEGEREC
jgi:hypothetical protein